MFLVHYNKNDLYARDEKHKTYFAGKIIPDADFSQCLATPVSVQRRQP